ncbi:MAG: endonuclease, partial [Betaproteobacteria bacterium]|nr:endonuclease [Betaproteobacteria bacterium]
MLKAFPIVLALAILCAAMAREVKAWGFELHELIARQAQAMLSQQAKTMLESLLAQEEGASLPSISTWADKHREFPTATWHYVNFPKGQCQYEQARDCPEGHCVIEAFAQQLKLLQTSKDPTEQLRALKFVVHLISDVHQPLHAAWGEDRGGNRFQLQAFGRGSNLHAFWDSTLARQAEGGLEALES